MNTVEALRLLALQAVRNGDVGYNLRYILRWYSKTFYTPLPTVEELPLEDVLQAYFETRYEEMSEIELHQETLKLLETEEHLRQQRSVEDAEDADAEEFARFTVQQIAAAAAGKAREVTEPTIKGVEAIPDSAPKVLPDIQMQFLNDEELFEGSFGPPDKKPG